LFPE